MTEDIQPEVLKRTQESLGKFIKKPVLSEKLLRKPPFRFLHDICTSAMKETGFFEDILSGNDVKIEHINDKEGKIAFLQKVIAAVENANNVKLTVKPNKIVAGHEPMKTNEFLQALANALEKQVQTRSPKKTLRKGKVIKPEVKNEDAVKKKNKTNVSKNAEVRKKKSVDKKPEEVTAAVAEIAETPSEPPPPEEGKINGEANNETITKETKTSESAVRPASAKFKRRTPSAHPESNIADRVLGDIVSNDPIEQQVEKKEEPEAEKLAKEEVPAVRPRTAIRPPSARPASARPAAPRIRDRGQVALQEEIVKPAVGKVNLISDQEAVQDDEELVSVQTTQEIADEPIADELIADEPTAEHGQLVNQILEAQRELEEKTTTKTTEIEWSSGGRGVAGATRKEVERLRSAVQTLTRSANPLGKLLEYLQEDVDSMQQELNAWRERNSALNLKLDRERSLTDQSIEPLKAHFAELEQSIQQEWEQIGTVKANVLRNDERIHRLFTGM